MLHQRRGMLVAYRPKAGGDGVNESVQLEVGAEAPEIDATATGDGPFRLSEQRGRWVVVYFYPRANTPG